VETPYRGDPPYVRVCVEGSLRRLGTDHVDLLLYHRIDPLVPLEETVGAMSDMVREGKVRHLGLCEVSPEELRRAHAVYRISVVQSEWSLWSRDIEDEVLPVARELGVGITPFAPLGRGFLSGAIRSLDDLPAEDTFRRNSPRFQADNLQRNLALVQGVRELAAEKRCTPAQLALGWLDRRGDDVVPIPGSDRPEFVIENVGALDVDLSDDDLARLEAAMPRNDVAGGRYPGAKPQQALGSGPA
jgi:aryl-alcohol dehydrogenase-like predicted oxidoreductase